MELVPALDSTHLRVFPSTVQSREKSFVDTADEAKAGSGAPRPEQPESITATIVNSMYRFIILTERRESPDRGRRAWRGFHWYGGLVLFDLSIFFWCRGDFLKLTLQFLRFLEPEELVRFRQ